MNSKFTALLVAGLCLNAAAISAQTTPENQQNRQEDRYRIGLRDKINVQVFRHPDLNQTVAVNPNGTITLFKITEPVVAVCKTERELADVITEAYKKEYLRNPEVNVIVTEQMSQSVAVMGAVEKPNNFYISRRVQLLELLALAGGPSKDAGSRLVVFRPGTNYQCQEGNSDADPIGLYSFNIRDLQEGKESLAMQPNDIVSVLPADIVFVYGNVNEQGQVVMRQPMTLRQAIASAKGIRAATDKDRVRIIRQKPGGIETDEIIVDLNAINRGKADDPFLQPNDIVALSEDRAKSILNNVAKSFSQGLGGLFYRPF
ncbi:MAG TPA: polysaccharide biosynthesis/export family protein [Pyrinomonadaceae bacterium]|nr:polysaccharide biosynthesis/export family protein [Pyrinomonadaceae bacterium]